MIVAIAKTMPACRAEQPSKIYANFEGYENFLVYIILCDCKVYIIVEVDEAI